MRNSRGRVNLKGESVGAVIKLICATTAGESIFFIFSTRLRHHPGVIFLSLFQTFSVLSLNLSLFSLTLSDSLSHFLFSLLSFCFALFVYTRIHISLALRRSSTPTTFREIRFVRVIWAIRAVMLLTRFARPCSRIRAVMLLNKVCPPLLVLGP